MNLFEVIKQEKYKNVIIPSLGTGHYGYMHQEVAEMVMQLLCDFCRNNDVTIIFNLLDETVKTIYKQYLEIGNLDINYKN